MKVKARDDVIAKSIKHPSGVKFGADGTAHWPDDRFTKRRIRDGDITAVDDEAPEQGSPSRLPGRGGLKPPKPPGDKPPEPKTPEVEPKR